MSINATIIGQFIVFFLFVWFCMKYVWPPIILIIEKRQKEINDSLFAAEQAKNKLESIKLDIIEQLKNAKIKEALIIEEANKNKMQIIQEAKISATKEYEKIINNAEKEINHKYEVIRKELQDKLSALVIIATEKIIKRSINMAQHNKIIDQLIDKL